MNQTKTVSQNDPARNLRRYGMSANEDKINEVNFTLEIGRLNKADKPYRINDIFQSICIFFRQPLIPMTSISHTHWSIFTLLLILLIFNKLALELRLSQLKKLH